VKSLLNRVWKEDEGVLTFEWILLITVLVIGIVGGLSAVRDAMITELGDVAQAMIALDQSYTILAPWEVETPDCIPDGATSSYFQDAQALSEGRKGAQTPPNQGPNNGCGTVAEGPDGVNFVP
jgi:Flp pilus assembly pilin Flp